LLAVGGNISKKRDDPYSALLVWDVQKAEEDPMSFLFGLPSGMLGMSDGDIYALAFSPDNKFLAAGDNTGHIWFCSRHRVDEDENTFFNWEITDPMSAN
jgi:WD40 repeat protein